MQIHCIFIVDYQNLWHVRHANFFALDTKPLSFHLKQRNALIHSKVGICMELMLQINLYFDIIIMYLTLVPQTVH